MLKINMLREFSAGGVVYKQSLALLTHCKQSLALLTHCKQSLTLRDKQSLTLRDKKFQIPPVPFGTGQANSKFQILWLVTKSTPSKLPPKSVWRLPKGWLDDEDNGKKPGLMARGLIKASENDLQNTALKEVREEGGVEAKIIKKIGTEKYFRKENNQTIIKFVTFYLMEWAKDSKEGFGLETDEIAWLSFNQAKKRLSYLGERKILDKAKNLLKDLQKQPFLL